MPALSSCSPVRSPLLVGDSEALSRVPAPFEVSVEPSDAEILVRVAGEIDIATVDQLRGVLLRYSDRDVVIDMARVTFMDTAALRLLIEQHRRGEQDGWRLVIADPHDRARELLEIAGLTSQLAMREGDGDDSAEQSD